MEAKREIVRWALKYITKLPKKSTEFGFSNGAKSLTNMPDVILKTRISRFVQKGAKGSTLVQNIVPDSVQSINS
jgi:hypothetical protein